MRGEGHYASMIAARFKIASRRLDLAQDLPKLSCNLFRPSMRPGDQMSLF